MRISLACIIGATFLVLLLGNYGEDGKELTIAIVDTDIAPMFAITGGVYTASSNVMLSGTDSNYFLSGWIGPTVLLTCNTGTNTKRLLVSSNLFDWTDTDIKVRGNGIEIPQPFYGDQNRFFKLED